MTSKPFEQWLEAKHPDANLRRSREWLIAAVRAHKQWGEGREVTEAEWDEAASEVEGIQIGGTPPNATPDTHKP